MKILVIGGTGTHGSQVVRGLRARKVTVRVLTRSQDKVKGLPGGVEAKATPADIDRQTHLLGHAPRSFEDFAMETARLCKA